MVVLDTDHLSLLEWHGREDTARLRARLDALAEPAVTTVVNFEEQTRGWLAYVGKAKTMVQLIEAYRRLHQHLENYRLIQVLDFDAVAATAFQRLQTERIRIGTMDLRIAAIVLARDALLLSRNRADFGKVPGLRVEDWTV